MDDKKPITKADVAFTRPENFALTLELCWIKNGEQMILCQKCISIDAPGDESMDKWVVVPVEHLVEIKKPEDEKPEQTVTKEP